jgi:hypothetical protein
MENINSTEGLKNAIQLLEVEQAEKLQQMKEQSLLAVEMLRPANLLKSAVKDIVSSPHLLNNMLDTGVGLATGFLSRKIFIGTSVNIFRKLFGSVLQLGVTSVATKNSDSIKSLGRFVIQRIFIRKGLNAKNVDR